MHPRAPALALLCALLLSACGSTDKQESEAKSPSGTTAPAPEAPSAIPSEVPLTATGDGDPAAAKVIRSWTDALRRGDVERATALWAVPSKVQNGTPVLTLSNRAVVRLFNDSLSCGSRLVSTGAATGGFTIAVFTLTERPDGDCGTGVGHRARTAIRVRGGRIAEWYWLPDDPGAPAPPAAPAAPAPPAEPDGLVV